MTDESAQSPQADMAQIIESAKRLGIELDEAEAMQWLTAMAKTEAQQEVVMNERDGVFGSAIVMLDFSPDDLAHFREIGRLVEFTDTPGLVETALALSGSAAQSKIQAHPGDADYFERVNILAPTREEACRILADIMRQKALSTVQGGTYQLIEVKFGSYPLDLVRDTRTFAAGSPIAWKPADIEAGQIEGFTPDGQPATVRWEEVAMDPGWCKLDWVVADPGRHQLANASNMLDVTWEAPDGTITPLDSYLDPYFQEVYLDATSVPIFAKLAKHVSADAMDEYVAGLRHEVEKYLTKDLNYGKVAKRLYNIFRLTGRYPEAAFLRELFDEPATMLYQVWSLIRTMDDATQPGSAIAMEHVLNQADELILAVTATLEGEHETEIVRRLLRLRDTLSRQRAGEALIPEAETARAEVINLVNNFFYDKLTALPAIREYLEEVKAE